MPITAGTAIGHNVRLVRLLAEGGMGSVWVADHLGLRTQVAVKFIAADAAADGAMMARFSREASAAAQIKSPHVVQIFDHGTADGIPYIVMELLEGESLGTRLNRLGRLDTRETSAIVIQVCRALSKAHTLGVVHRDIKPDNVFLTDSDGELFVKVLDFGIAKSTADAALGMTATGAAVGTPHYMSPEQIVSAKNVSAATDLWAVGVMAYRCLTGVLPFDADTFGGLCLAIHRGTFTPVRSLRPELPPAVDAWFAQALQLDASRRFASAKQLADRLSAALRVSPEQIAAVPAALPANRRGESAAAQAELGERAPSGTRTLEGIQGAAVRRDRQPEPGKRASRKVWLVLSGVAVAGLAAGAVLLSGRATTNAPLSNPAVLSTGSVAAAPELPASEPKPAPTAESIAVVPPAPERPVEALPATPDAGHQRSTETAGRPPTMPRSTPRVAPPTAPRQGRTGHDTPSAPTASTGSRATDHGF
jgi:hypothetical protein